MRFTNNPFGVITTWVVLSNERARDQNEPAVAKKTKNLCEKNSEIGILSRKNKIYQTWINNN